MNKDSNFIEYISPNVAAKKLGIAVTTLRKYSSLIEKTSGNKSYFNRDSNNSRLYTNSDVSVLKRVVALKVRPDFSLEKSIKHALSENNVSDVSDTDTRFESDTSNDMQPIQDDKIKKYEKKEKCKKVKKETEYKKNKDCTKTNGQEISDVFPKVFSNIC